jgi:DNA-binding NtrC family response regulator
MHKKRVMVIEADDERCKQVNFLLRLASYESRSVTDVVEAVNWARLCQQSGEEAFCLLVNSVRSTEECVGILQTLSRHAFFLPVVLVRRDKWDGAVPTARFPTLQILSCLPATLNAALSAIDQCQPQRRSATLQVRA